MDKTDWNSIKIDYENGLTYQQLSDKYNVKVTTIRVHRSRGKWKCNAKKKRNDKSVTLHKNVTSKKVTKIVNDNEDITDKQKQFCLLYLQTFNATRSYQETYQCSYEIAMPSGARLLRNVKIKELLRKCKQEQADEVLANQNDIVNDMLKASRSNISDYITIDVQKVIDPDTLNEDGTPHHYYTVQIIPKDLSKLDTTAVKSISSGRDGFKVDLIDKSKLWKDLMPILDVPTGDVKTNPLVKAIKRSAETGETKIDENDLEGNDDFS